jgi:hypothetical protein
LAIPIPKNNFISQFLILNFAIEKIGRCENNTLSSSTWSPNKSYYAVDHVFQATHRRPYISCSDEANLRQ